MRRAALAAGAIALALPDAAGAHGLGGVRDLPVPLWLFFYGAAAVLVVSFVALGALWRQPRLAPDRGRPLPGPLQRLALAPATRAALGALGLALLAVVWAAALVGERSVSQNLAPTFVWVVFWLGLVPLVVLLGDIWSALNPWRAAADAVAWGWRRAGRSWSPLAEYPERLGRWPAAIGLLAFAALELAYPDPADPRVLAVAITGYSYLTWLAIAVFGREAWLRNGEAFSVYFGLLARIAPLGTREGERGREVVVRPPLSALATVERVPGTVAFLAVMLGSVAFDGFSGTVGWQNLRASLVGPLLIEAPARAELLGMLLDLAGLAAAVALVAVAYLAAVAAARAAVASTGLAEAFILSLVPIALAYNVAHYFSLFVLQAQFALPLASDPFGFGWDVLGTGGVRPWLRSLPPNAVWYVQAGALVVGHVLGLVVAHDRAVALFRSPRAALQTQYAMLALMVVYTVGGLWLLAEG